MARKSHDTIKIDNFVGKQIHSQRVALGLSRVQLRDKIGVSIQQLQKYEDGSNRVTAGRLYLIAKALNKSLDYFFEDELATTVTASNRLMIEVSRNFSKLPSFHNQVAINTLIKSLIKGE